MAAVERVLRAEQHVLSPVEMYVVHLVKTLQAEPTQVEALRERDVHYRCAYDRAQFVSLLDAELQSK